MEGATKGVIMKRPTRPTEGEIQVEAICVCMVMQIGSLREWTIGEAESDEGGVW